MAAASSISPGISFAPASANARAFFGVRTRQCTSSPRARTASTRCEPTNPVPPVTRTRIAARPIPFARFPAHPQHFAMSAAAAQVYSSDASGNSSRRHSSADSLLAFAMLHNKTFQRWIGGTFFEWLGIDLVARMEMVGLAMHKDWARLKVLRRARRQRWSMVTNNEMYIVQSLALGLLDLPGDYVEVGVYQG